MRWSPDGRFGIWDLLVILLVAGLAVGLGLALWGNLPGGPAEAVLVTQDGQEIDRVPLTKEVQNRVYSGKGYTLQVEIQEGSVQVTETDCPGKDCLRTGAIHRPGQRIICLPAGIVMELTGEPSGGADLKLG